MKKNKIINLEKTLPIGYILNNKSDGNQPQNNIQTPIVTNFVVKAKKENTNVANDIPERFTPSVLHLTKNKVQEIGLDYQMINWDDIDGEIDRLKIQNNKLIIKDDFKTLIVKTNITALVNNPAKVTMKIYKERNGIKGEIRTVTKSKTATFEDIQIIDAQKDDIISLEFAYDTLAKVNDDNQTYLDIIAF